VVFITADRRTNATYIAEELELLAFAAVPDELRNSEWWI
jgi:hypothetical protein